MANNGEQSLARRVAETGRASGFAASNCTVTLSTADALSLGLSLEALIRAAKVPAGAIEVFKRVSDQMVLAALAQGGAR